MLVIHPRGDGVGGRAEDDFDSGFAHGVDDAVHPGVFEAAVFGLPEAPGGLAHADDGDVGLLHEGDVFVEAARLQVCGHVLVVVGGAVENVFPWSRGIGLGFCCGALGQGSAGEEGGEKGERFKVTEHFWVPLDYFS